MTGLEVPVGQLKIPRLPSQDQQWTEDLRDHEVGVRA